MSERAFHNEIQRAIGVLLDAMHATPERLSDRELEDITGLGLVADSWRLARKSREEESE